MIAIHPGNCRKRRRSDLSCAMAEDKRQAGHQDNPIIIRSDDDSFSSSTSDAVKQRLDVELRNEEKSPTDFAICLCQANGFDVKIQSTASCDAFQTPTQEEIELYDNEVISAVREQQMDVLRAMHNAGRRLQCCNQFGESLLHMACRRGLLNAVEFMIGEANVSLYVKDDYGRTPMHDACWAPAPNFPLMKLLVETAPEQLFLSDIRGHTPLSYARKSDWRAWKAWLLEHEHLFARLSQAEKAST